jgi:hypothetical protein
MKRRIIHIVVFILLILFFSCERYDPVNVGEVDCYECYSLKPEWVRLNVKLTINNENKAVPLVIYIGNIEDGNVDWVDTSYSDDYWVDVHPDAYYSVTAEYKDGNKTIFAVDGDRVNLNYSDNSCDEPCYYATGGYIDVQLKK